MKAIAAWHDNRTDSTSSLLSAREENALCRRWHDHHDIAAARRLVGSHLHLVAGIAMAHRGSGVPAQELIGDGYVGLMQAACRYDPTCGARFTIYATWCVQTAIRQSVLRASPLMQADTSEAETVTALLPLHAPNFE